MTVKFESAVIDGQPVMRRSATVSAGLYDQQTMLLLSRLLKDAGADISSGNMVAYTFTNTAGVTINNGEITGGVLRSVITPAVAGGDNRESVDSILPTSETPVLAGNADGYSYRKGWAIISSTIARYAGIYGGFNGVNNSSSAGNYAFGNSGTTTNVTLLFDAPLRFDDYTLYTYESSGAFYPARSWNTWTCEVTYDNGATWVPADTRSGVTFPSSSVGQVFTPTFTGTMVDGIRYDVTANNGDSSTYLTEIEINGRSIDELIPAMAANSQDGYVATVDSGSTAYAVFDQATSIAWTSATTNGGWVQIELPADVLVLGYSLCCKDGTSSVYPADWHIIKSTDGGTNWSTIDTQTGQVLTAIPTHYAISQTEEGAMYRLVIDAMSQAGYSGGVGNWQMYGYSQTDGEYPLSEATPATTNQLDAVLDPVTFDAAKDYTKVLIVGENKDITDGQLTLAAADADLTVTWNEDGSTTPSGTLVLNSSTALGLGTTLWQLDCEELLLNGATAASFSLKTNENTAGSFPNIEITAFAFIPREEE